MAKGKKQKAKKERKEKKAKLGKDKHKFSKKKRLILSGFGLTSFLLISFFLFFIFKDLPSPTRLSSFPFPASTLIYDRDGELLYEIYAEKSRMPIKLEDLPEYLQWATIASEDRNFYSHHGFDLKGILRAAYNTLFKGSLQGASTITQQLVKNALLTPERSWRRKIREAVLTGATEILYSKEEILEMYLNQAPYGGTAWGVEAAAKTYFNRRAADLSLAEAALLAGLPASPTRFSPFGAHPEKAKERQLRVLKQMAEEGFLSQEESEQAGQEELNYAPQLTGIKAPHFVLYVKELLVEKFGEKMVEQGGLKVTTTLDWPLQEFSQQVVKEEVGKMKSLRVSNGAALVTQPQTGEILAMIGSKDYFDEAIDGNVNLTLRSRQPGSSIKPLNYALAFEEGRITPATVLNDLPTCFQVSGQKLYCPLNYDNQFHGPVQARFALGNSYNIPAVKVLALNGLENFVERACLMGIASFQDPSLYGLSLTLGGGEVKMTEMATAFSAFATAGIRQDLWAIKKVEDSQGKVIFSQPELEGPRVLSMGTSFLINHILSDNNARSAAFGASSKLMVKDHPEVAVKTGTTNDWRDNWTIGWTPQILVTTWVGNNKNQPMSYVVSGSNGASVIWNKIITEILKEEKQYFPLKPGGVVGAHVCQLSGQMPNPEAPCETRFEYFLEDKVPQEIENLSQSIHVDKSTGQPISKQTLPENWEIQEHPAIVDPLGTFICLDCPPVTEPMTILYPLEIEILPETGKLEEENLDL